MIREIELNNSSNNRLVLSSLNHFTAIQNNVPFYSIKYVHRGREVYGIDGKTYPVFDGEFLISGYGKSYDIEVNSKAHVEGLCLFINQPFLLDVHQNLKKNEQLLLDAPFEKCEDVEITEMIYSQQFNPFGNYLSTLYTQLQANDQSCQIHGDDIFYNLSVQFLNQQMHVLGQQKLGLSKKGTAKELFTRLLKAKKMIDEQPEKEWTVSELSRSVALSEFHFYRSFKKAFSVPPYQYIILQRIVKATRLLQHRSNTIADVAMHCGFADIYSFSKAFKKYKGVCPTSFRRF